MPQTVTNAESFASLGVPQSLVTVLAERGITQPFPIQTATLRDTLAGRDVLGRGRTGSGKTLAFSLPLVARLAEDDARRRPGYPRGLVLAPTRELANQIMETIEPLATALGLRSMTIFGGVNQNRQTRQLARGVDIVVATPGRLEDLMQQGEVHLDKVAITVLDEADHMADLGFLPGVTRILKATPAGTQRLLFSATLDRGVDKLVKQFLREPLHHSVDTAQSPVQAMTHHVFLVPDASRKKQLVNELASGELRRLLFTRTKHQARRLARQLTADGIPAVEMHGNLSQNARERGLRAFSSGEVRVMVATDIAARGIHVDDVDLVVHVDPPAEHKAYLHRSGRTARAGQTGDVVTVVLPEQRNDFRALARAAKIDLDRAASEPDPQRVQALVGVSATRIKPDEAPSAAAQRVPADRGEGGSRRGGGSRSSSRSGQSNRGQSNRGGQERGAQQGRSGGQSRSNGSRRRGGSGRARQRQAAHS